MLDKRKAILAAAALAATGAAVAWADHQPLGAVDPTGGAQVRSFGN